MSDKDKFTSLNDKQVYLFDFMSNDKNNITPPPPPPQPEPAPLRWIKEGSNDKK